MLSMTPPRPTFNIVLSGEYDLVTAPKLEGELAELDGDTFIDCAGLTFIDLRGLRPLMSARRRCTERGSRFVLIHPPRCLMRLLEAAGLEAVFEMQIEE